MPVAPEQQDHTKKVILHDKLPFISLVKPIGSARTSRRQILPAMQVQAAFQDSRKKKYTMISGRSWGDWGEYYFGGVVGGVRRLMLNLGPGSFLNLGFGV